MKALSWIFSLLLALLFTAAAFYFSSLSFQNVLQGIWRAGWLGLLAVCFAITLQILFQSLSWHFLLQVEGYSPSLFSVWLATCTGWAGNYFTPSMYLGGEPLRALVLSKLENIPFRHALTSVLAHKLYELLSFLFFLLFSAFFVFWGFFFRFSLLFFFTLFSLLLLLFTILFFLHRLGEKRIPLAKTLSPLLGQWSQAPLEEMEQHFKKLFHYKHPLCQKTFFWMLFFHLSVFLRPLGYLFAIPIPFTISHLAFLFLSLQFIQAFQLTPGGFGIVEGGLVGVFQFLSFPIEHGITYALFTRVGELLFVGIGLSSFWFPSRKEKAMKKTPLYSQHLALDAKMVEFAGFSMPLYYTSIQEEHLTVRNGVGLFDLCHMGRIVFHGKEAGEYLHYLVTNNVLKMKVGDAHYALLLNERGTILDDLIVYRTKEEEYLVVCNAANREKVLQWCESHKGERDCHIEDQSEVLGMVAVQGKKAEDVVAKLLGEEIRPLSYYHCAWFSFEDTPLLLARTGYTGEDGFELYLASEKLEELWQKILKVGEEEGIRPIGLGARDTLRLEAAMPLYGHEITEETNPLEAGLSFAVKFKKGDFIGREALLKVKQEGVKRKLVCLEVRSKRIARQGAKLFDGEQEVGFVTSGTFSPFFQKSIAMGYVPKELAQLGQELSVQIGKKRHPIVVVPRPFYKRSG